MVINPLDCLINTLEAWMGVIIGVLIAFVLFALLVALILAVLKFLFG